MKYDKFFEFIVHTRKKESTVIHVTVDMMWRRTVLTGCELHTL